MNLLVVVDGALLTKIVIIAACVMAALALLYGMLRKFSRMSWIAWQASLVFAATFLLRFIPVINSGMPNFFMTAALVFIVMALVMLVGKILRPYFLAAEKGKGGARFFNRFVGGLTALYDIVFLAAVVGGVVLLFLQGIRIEAFNPVRSVLDPIYQNAIWTKFFAGHVQDLFLVTCIVCFARCGYKIGLLRSLITLIMFALTFIAAVGAMVLTLRLGFLRSFSGKIGGAFGSLPAPAAAVLGYGIVVLIVFLLFFIVVILLGVLFNMLMNKLGTFRTFNFLNAAILSIVYFVVALAFIAAIDGGTYLLLRAIENGTLQAKLGNMAENFEAQIAMLKNGLEYLQSVFTSSPLSDIFYRFNPLRLLF